MSARVGRFGRASRHGIEFLHVALTTVVGIHGIIHARAFYTVCRVNSTRYYTRTRRSQKVIWWPHIIIVIMIIIIQSHCRVVYFRCFQLIGNRQHGDKKRACIYDVYTRIYYMRVQIYIYALLLRSCI